LEQAALDFHNTREQYPRWFQSQLGNKMWYGVVGAPDVISHSCAALPEIIRLEVDGGAVPLPDDIEGLMLLNITSYMGGVNLWTCGRGGQQQGDAPARGSPDRYGCDSNPALLARQSVRAEYVDQSMSDGMIEVVAVYGAWHLGQLQACASPPL
jgi:diacylglycerol kinase (ATP)